ncbi:MAG: flagellar hook protein FlgE [Burkholderiales bacterium]|nr:flagellar hook protein FlgE [Burkholderiales bacterium]
MSFQTGLSGLSASSKSLDVIGNNIANANTVGMKASRAEFADIVSSSLGASGAGGAGIGVSMANISQSFTQGNISITGNNMDVAINGSGFFQVTRPDGSGAFTRDGQFKIDKSGNIVTNTGANVMGYPTDSAGTPTSVTPQAMTVPTGASIAANATSAITAELNLDARAAVATPTTSPTQYGTSLTTYDTQGVPITVNLYFVKSAVDTWDVYDKSATAQTAITSGTPGGLFQMKFNPDGSLLSPATAQAMSITSPNPNVGTAGVFSANIDVSKATQFGSGFNVSNLTQDGYTAGDLIGVNIETSGNITTRYSNGQTMTSGRIALADFRNTQGLAPTGGGEYLETFASGQPIQGSPGMGKFGELRSGALEDSNVDLTAELVNMMTAQRGYQANAQTIKTQDQILSTLVNLR